MSSVSTDQTELKELYSRNNSDFDERNEILTITGHYADSASATSEHSPEILDRQKSSKATLPHSFVETSPYSAQEDPETPDFLPSV